CRVVSGLHVLCQRGSLPGPGARKTSDYRRALPTHLRRPNVTTAMLYRLSLVAAATLVAACSDKTPLGPSGRSAIAPPAANRQSDEVVNPDLEQALAAMRAATAPYHDIQNALNDGFALRITCLAPGEDELVGDIYTNRTRAR